MDFQAGDTVGDYQIVELVGSGGAGQVFKARHLVTRRIEAIKVLSESVSSDDVQAKRFLREIQVQARLNHRNIAAVHNAFRWHGRLVMVMEFVDGNSLQRVLESGPVPLSKALDYVDQTLQGLAYAHASDVVHRDIKPANLMITPDGTVKITDFGLAKSLKEPALTQTGDIQGTLYYTPPEQVKGLEQDNRSDLYSLGAVLYELAAGKRPFDLDQSFALMQAHVNDIPRPPSKVNPSLPAVLDKIALFALEKVPEDRFQTADEFQKAIASVRNEPSKQTAGHRPGHAGSQAAEESSPERASVAARAWKALARISHRLTSEARNRPAITSLRLLALLNALSLGKAPKRYRALLLASILSLLLAALFLTSAGRTVLSDRAPDQSVHVDSKAAKEPGAGSQQQELKSSPYRKGGGGPVEVVFQPKSYRLIHSLPEPGAAGVVAVSPDGKRLAAGTEQSTIKIWDAATGSQLATLRGHNSRVSSLSFSADGSRLASGSWDGTAKVWDVGAGRALHSLFHNKDVTSVALSSGGGKLAAGTADKTITLWDLRTEVRLANLRGHKRNPQGLAFSPNGGLLASVSAENAVRLWRLPFEGGRDELRGLDLGATAVSFSPDSRLVAAAGSGRAKVWNVQSKQKVADLRAPGWLHALIPAPSGNFLLLGATPDSLKLWDVARSKEVSEITPNGAALSIALAADGERMAAATDRSFIQIWEAAR